MSRLLVALAVGLLAGVAGCLEDGPIPVGDDGCPVRDVVIDQELSVRNMVGGGRVGPTARQAFDVPTNDTWPMGARWSCVRAVEATIEWSNGADRGADLYVGLEDAEAGISVVGTDHQELPADGSHTESVEAPAPTNPSRLADGLTLVVYSDWASLSAGSLRVHAVVTLKVPASEGGSA